MVVMLDLLVSLAVAMHPERMVVMVGVPSVRDARG